MILRQHERQTKLAALCEIKGFDSLDAMLEAAAARSESCATLHLVALLSHIPSEASAEGEWMTRTRAHELHEKAAAERRRCGDWLMKFMTNDQPKVCHQRTISATRPCTTRIAKSSFDAACIDAIETSGRHEPLRRRLRTRN